MKHRMPIRVVGAREAKNSFGEILRRVYEDDETQIIARSGMPVAAIISISELERFYPEKMRAVPNAKTSAKNQRAWRNMMSALADMQKGGEKFSEEEVEQDVQRAVQEVRHRKGKK